MAAGRNLSWARPDLTAVPLQRRDWHDLRKEMSTKQVATRLVDSYSLQKARSGVNSRP